MTFKPSQHTGFLVIFCNFKMWRTFESNYCDKTVKDRLGQPTCKLSELNVNLSTLNFGILGLRSSRYRASNMDTSSKYVVSANIHLLA